MAFFNSGSDLGFVGGVAAAISNYFSNRETNATNLQIQQETNAANRELAERQNQWNLEMWNRQNAYNDPSAQMSRLRAAGINPALAVANGSMMNEAAPAPEAAGSRDQAAKMQAYYLDPLTMAQIANINADTEQKKKQVEYLGSEIQVNENNIESGKVRLEFDKNLSEAQTGYYIKETEMLNHKMDEIDANRDLLLANVDLTNKEVAIKEIERIFAEETVQSRIDQEYQKLQNMMKQEGLMDSEIALNRQQFQQLAQMFVINKEMAQQQLAIMINERKLSDATFRYDLNNAFMENQANKLDLAAQKLTIKANTEKYNRWHGWTGAKACRYANDVLGSVGQVLSGAAVFAVPGKAPKVNRIGYK